MAIINRAELREKATRVNSTQGAWIAISGADILALLDELDAAQAEINEIVGDRHKLASMVRQDVEIIADKDAHIAALEAQVAEARQLADTWKAMSGQTKGTFYYERACDLENALAKALREKAPKGATKE